MEKNKIDVLYFSCPYDLSGYGSVSRNHLIGMSTLDDMSVRLKVKRFWSGVSPDLGEDLNILNNMERNPIRTNKFIFIEHLTPENFFVDPRAAYHIAYTPFETDGAPVGWLLGLKAMDEVWVPSKNNKAAYVKMNIDPRKIKVIQHGVDIDKYNPDISPLKYNRGKFNFGSVFDWTERKNPVALIRAYFNAFTKREDVTLTLRTFWRFPIDKSKEYIEREIQLIKDSYPGRTVFPKILLWLDTIEDSVMPNLYRSFDCFVSTSRGEGFGLPLLESMACGVPTIGPELGGNSEFMNKNNSFLVGGSMVPITHHRFLQMQPQYANQSWFDINEEELSKNMRYVYDNYDKAKDKAVVGLNDIKNNFTWKHTISKIHDRIVEIDQMISSDNKCIKDDMDYMGRV